MGWAVFIAKFICKRFELTHFGANFPFMRINENDNICSVAVIPINSIEYTYGIDVIAKSRRDVMAVKQRKPQKYLQITSKKEL